MSVERSQDLLLPPAPLRRRGVDPNAVEAEELGAGEQRLTQAIRRHRGDSFALLAYVQRLAPAERSQALVTLTRELGPERARAVCRQAFGETHYARPQVDSGLDEPLAPSPQARYELQRAAFVADRVSQLSTRGRRGELEALDLASAMTDNVRRVVARMVRETERAGALRSGPSSGIAARIDRLPVEEPAPKAVALRDAARDESLDDVRVPTDSSGEALSPAVLKRVSDLLGHDFSHVRVHTGEAAACFAESMGANAVTVGCDIYFNTGKFDPSTPAGRRVLVHELTHVAQYDHGRIRPSEASGGRVAAPGARSMAVSAPGDSVEREAKAAERLADAPAQARGAPRRGEVATVGSTRAPAAPTRGGLEAPVALRDVSSSLPAAPAPRARSTRGAAPAPGTSVSATSQTASTELGSTPAPGTKATPSKAGGTSTAKGSRRAQGDSADEEDAVATASGASLSLKLPALDLGARSDSNPYGRLMREVEGGYAAMLLRAQGTLIESTAANHRAIDEAAQAAELQIRKTQTDGSNVDAVVAKYAGKSREGIVAREQESIRIAHERYTAHKKLVGSVASFKDGMIQTVLAAYRESPVWPELAAIGKEIGEEVKKRGEREAKRYTRQRDREGQAADTRAINAGQTSKAYDEFGNGQDTGVAIWNRAEELKYDQLDARAKAVTEVSTGMAAQVVEQGAAEVDAAKTRGIASDVRAIEQYFANIGAQQDAVFQAVLAGIMETRKAAEAALAKQVENVKKSLQESQAKQTKEALALVRKGAKEKHAQVDAEAGATARGIEQGLASARAQLLEGLSPFDKDGVDLGDPEKAAALAELSSGLQKDLQAQSDDVAGKIADQSKPFREALKAQPMAVAAAPKAQKGGDKKGPSLEQQVSAMFAALDKNFAEAFAGVVDKGDEFLGKLKPPDFMRLRGQINKQIAELPNKFREELRKASFERQTKLMDEAAADAAKKVKPRWVEALKTTAKVGLIVGGLVVGILTGGFFIAAIGAMIGMGMTAVIVGGALGGMVATAIQTIAMNALDERPLMEGMQAALISSGVAGALGGGVGMLANLVRTARALPPSVYGQFARVSGVTGVELVGNVGAGMLGEAAAGNNPFDPHAVLQNGAMSAVMSLVSMRVFGARISNSFDRLSAVGTNAGERFGHAMGGKHSMAPPTVVPEGEQGAPADLPAPTVETALGGKHGPAANDPTVAVPEVAPAANDPIYAQRQTSQASGTDGPGTVLDASSDRAAFSVAGQPVNAGFGSASTALKTYAAEAAPQYKGKVIIEGQKVDIGGEIVHANMVEGPDAKQLATNLSKGLQQLRDMFKFHSDYKSAFRDRAVVEEQGGTGRFGNRIAPVTGVKLGALEKGKSTAQAFVDKLSGDFPALLAAEQVLLKNKNTTAFDLEKAVPALKERGISVAGADLRAALARGNLRTLELHPNLADVLVFDPNGKLVDASRAFVPRAGAEPAPVHAGAEPAQVADSAPGAAAAAPSPPVVETVVAPEIPTRSTVPSGMADGASGGWDAPVRDAKGTYYQPLRDQGSTHGFQSVSDFAKSVQASTATLKNDKLVGAGIADKIDPHALYDDGTNFGHQLTPDSVGVTLAELGPAQQARAKQVGDALAARLRGLETASKLFHEELGKGATSTEIVRDHLPQWKEAGLLPPDFEASSLGPLKSLFGKSARLAINPDLVAHARFDPQTGEITRLYHVLVPRDAALHAAGDRAAHSIAAAALSEQPPAAGMKRVQVGERTVDVAANVEYEIVTLRMHDGEHQALRILPKKWVTEPDADGHGGVYASKLNQHAYALLHNRGEIALHLPWEGRSGFHLESARFAGVSDHAVRTGRPDLVEAHEGGVHDYQSSAALRGEDSAWLSRMESVDGKPMAGTVLGEYADYVVGHEVPAVALEARAYASSARRASVGDPAKAKQVLAELARGYRSGLAKQQAGLHEGALALITSSPDSVTFSKATVTGKKGASREEISADIVEASIVVGNARVVVPLVGDSYLPLVGKPEARAQLLRALQERVELVARSSREVEARLKAVETEAKALAEMTPSEWSPARFDKLVEATSEVQGIVKPLSHLPQNAFGHGRPPGAQQALDVDGHALPDPAGNVPMLQPRVALDQLARLAQLHRSGQNGQDPRVGITMQSQRDARFNDLIRVLGMRRATDEQAILIFRHLERAGYRSPETDLAGAREIARRGLRGELEDGPAQVASPEAIKATLREPDGDVPLLQVRLALDELHRASSLYRSGEGGQDPRVGMKMIAGRNNRFRELVEVIGLRDATDAQALAILGYLRRSGVRSIESDLPGARAIVQQGLRGELPDLPARVEAAQEHAATPSASGDPLAARSSTDPRATAPTGLRAKLIDGQLEMRGKRAELEAVYRLREDAEHARMRARDGGDTWALKDAERLERDADAMAAELGFGKERLKQLNDEIRAGLEEAKAEPNLEQRVQLLRALERSSAGARRIDPQAIEASVVDGLDLALGRALGELRSRTHRTALELEMPWSPEVLRALTTDDGSIYPVYWRGEKKLPPSVERRLGAAGNDSYVGKPEVLKAIRWDDLTVEERLDLIIANHPQASYYFKKGLPGLRIRDDASGGGALQKPEYQSHVAQQGPELHYVQAGRASRTGDDAFAAADRLGASEGQGSVHQHVPGQLPQRVRDLDPVARMHYVETWRQQNMVAEFELASMGAAARQRARESDGNRVVESDRMTPDSLLRLNEALADPSKRVTGDELKTMLVAARSGDLLEGVSDKSQYISKEIRAQDALESSDPRFRARFTDAIQDTALTGRSGMSERSLEDWYRQRVNSSPHDYRMWDRPEFRHMRGQYRSGDLNQQFHQQQQALRSLHFNRPSVLDDAVNNRAFLARIEPEFSFAAPVLRKLGINEENYGANAESRAKGENYNIRMLVHDWTADPVLHDRPDAQAKVIEAQKVALKAIAAGEDPTRAVTRFVQTSGLRERFQAAMGMAEPAARPARTPAPEPTLDATTDRVASSVAGQGAGSGSSGGDGPARAARVADRRWGQMMGQPPLGVQVEGARFQHLGHVVDYSGIPVPGQRDRVVQGIYRVTMDDDSVWIFREENPTRDQVASENLGVSGQRSTRELAQYHTSLHLRLGSTPTTLAATVGGRRGTLQRYHDESNLAQQPGGLAMERPGKIDWESIQATAVLHYVTGDLDGVDRNLLNRSRRPGGRGVRSIDGEMTFTPDDETNSTLLSPDYLGSAEAPQELLPRVRERLARTDIPRWMAALRQDGLSEAQIEAAVTRLRRVQEQGLGVIFGGNRRAVPSARSSSAESTAPEAFLLPEGFNLPESFGAPEAAASAHSAADSTPFPALHDTPFPALHDTPFPVLLDLPVLDAVAPAAASPEPKLPTIDGSGDRAAHSIVGAASRDGAPASSARSAHGGDADALPGLSVTELHDVDFDLEFSRAAQAPAPTPAAQSNVRKAIDRFMDGNEHSRDTVRAVLASLDPAAEGRLAGALARDPAEFRRQVIELIDLGPNPAARTQVVGRTYEAAGSSGASLNQSASTAYGRANGLEHTLYRGMSWREFQEWQASGGLPGNDADAGGMGLKFATDELSKARDYAHRASTAGEPGVIVEFAPHQVEVSRKKGDLEGEYVIRRLHAYTVYGLSGIESGPARVLRGGASGARAGAPGRAGAQPAPAAAAAPRLDASTDRASFSVAGQADRGSSGGGGPSPAALRQRAFEDPTKLRTAFGPTMDVGHSSQAFDGPQGASGDLVRSVRDGDDVHLLLADMAGHGPEAAALALRVHERFGAGLDQALVKEGLAGVDRSLDELNMRPGQDQNHHLVGAMSHLVVNTKTGLLRVEGGGDTRTFVLSASGEVKILDATGPQLGAGFFAMASDKMHVHQLAPRDQVITVSDGVLDRMGGASGPETGVKAVLKLLADAKPATVAETLRLLRAPDGSALVDDTSVLAFQWRGEGSAATPVRGSGEAGGEGSQARERARRAARQPEQDVVLANAELADGERMPRLIAELPSVGTRTADELAHMERGLIAAHKEGADQPGKDGNQAEVYNFTWRQLRAKMGILEQHGFTTPEADFAVRHGYAGWISDLARTIGFGGGGGLVENPSHAQPREGAGARVEPAPADVAQRLGVPAELLFPKDAARTFMFTRGIGDYKVCSLSVRSQQEALEVLGHLAKGGVSPDDLARMAAAIRRGEKYDRASLSLGADLQLSLEVTSPTYMAFKLDPGARELAPSDLKRFGARLTLDQVNASAFEPLLHHRLPDGLPASSGAARSNEAPPLTHDLRIARRHFATQDEFVRFLDLTRALGFDTPELEGFLSTTGHHRGVELILERVRMGGLGPETKAGLQRLAEHTVVRNASSSGTTMRALTFAEHTEVDVYRGSVLREREVARLLQMGWSTYSEGADPAFAGNPFDNFSQGAHWSIDRAVAQGFALGGKKPQVQHEPYYEFIVHARVPKETLGKTRGMSTFSNDEFEYDTAPIRPSEIVGFTLLLPGGKAVELPASVLQGGDPGQVRAILEGAGVPAERAAALAEGRAETTAKPAPGEPASYAPVDLSSIDASVVDKQWSVRTWTYPAGQTAPASTSYEFVTPGETNTPLSTTRVYVSGRSASDITVQSWTLAPLAPRSITLDGGRTVPTLDYFVARARQDLLAVLPHEAGVASPEASGGQAASAEPAGVKQSRLEGAALTRHNERLDEIEADLIGRGYTVRRIKLEKGVFGLEVQQAPDGEPIARRLARMQDRAAGIDGTAQGTSLVVDPSLFRRLGAVGQYQDFPNRIVVATVKEVTTTLRHEQGHSLATTAIRGSGADVWVSNPRHLYRNITVYGAKKVPAGYEHSFSVDEIVQYRREAHSEGGVADDVAQLDSYLRGQGRDAEADALGALRVASAREGKTAREAAVAFHEATTSVLTQASLSNRITVKTGTTSTEVFNGGVRIMLIEGAAMDRAQLDALLPKLRELHETEGRAVHLESEPVARSPEYLEGLLERLRPRAGAPVRQPSADATAAPKAEVTVAVAPDAPAPETSAPGLSRSPTLASARLARDAAPDGTAAGAAAVGEVVPGPLLRSLMERGRYIPPMGDLGKAKPLPPGFHQGAIPEVTPEMRAASERGDPAAEVALRRLFSDVKFEEFVYYGRRNGGERLAHLTDVEIVAVSMYPDRHSGDINRALRSGDPGALAEWQPVIDAMDRGLAKLPDTVGLGHRFVDGGLDLSKFVEGAVVTEQAFTSTSANKSWSAGRGKQANFRIMMLSGKWLGDMTPFGYEAELLIPRGTRFRVDMKTKDPGSGRPIIHLVEIPPRGSSPASGGIESSPAGRAGQPSPVEAQAATRLPSAAVANDPVLSEPTQRTGDAVERTVSITLDGIRGIPELAAGLPKSAGVSEGYTLEQHTQMVLRQYLRYFADAKLPGGVDQAFMLRVLSVHDAGKPAAVEGGNVAMQHAETLKLLDRYGAQLGFDDRQLAIARALIGGDPVGQYLQGKLELKTAAAKIRDAAREAGLPVQEYMELLTVYYQSDAISYTAEAGGQASLEHLFARTPTGRPRVGTRLKFGAGTEARYQALEEAALDAAPATLDLAWAAQHVGELRNRGELAADAYHGTSSAVLDGLAQSGGRLLAMDQQAVEGIATGSGQSSGAVGGITADISLGLGAEGLGISWAYSRANQELPSFNPQVYSDGELAHFADVLNGVLRFRPKDSTGPKNEWDTLGQRWERTARQHRRLIEEQARRAALPPEDRQRQGGRENVATYPILFELARERSWTGDAARPFRGSGGTSIDLRKSLRRVFTPAVHVEALRARLGEILGRTDIEVVPMEGLDALTGTSREYFQNSSWEVQRMEIEASRWLTSAEEGLAATNTASADDGAFFWEHVFGSQGAEQDWRSLAHLGPDRRAVFARPDRARVALSRMAPAEVRDILEVGGGAAGGGVEALARLHHHFDVIRDPALAPNVHRIRLSERLKPGAASATPRTISSADILAHANGLPPSDFPTVWSLAKELGANGYRLRVVGLEGEPRKIPLRELFRELGQAPGRSDISGPQEYDRLLSVDFDIVLEISHDPALGAPRQGVAATAASESTAGPADPVLTAWQRLQNKPDVGSLGGRFFPRAEVRDGVPTEVYPDFGQARLVRLNELSGLYRVQAREAAERLLGYLEPSDKSLGIKLDRSLENIWFSPTGTIAIIERPYILPARYPPVRVEKPGAPRSTDAATHADAAPANDAHQAAAEPAPRPEAENAAGAASGGLASRIMRALRQRSLSLRLAEAPDAVDAAGGPSHRGGVGGSQRGAIDPSLLGIPQVAGLIERGVQALQQRRSGAGRGGAASKDAAGEGREDAFEWPWDASRGQNDAEIEEISWYAPVDVPHAGIQARRERAGALAASLQKVGPDGDAGVLLQLDQLLEAYGMVSRAPAGGALRIVPAVDKLTRQGTAHLRDGSIDLTREMRDDAVEFLMLFQSGQLARAPHVARLANAMDGLIHERIHHASHLPPDMTFARGGIRVIEELVTEVAARKVTREMFGLGGSEQLALPARRHEINEMRPYDHFIYPMVEAISEVAGVRLTVAASRLEAAALVFKGRDAPLMNSYAAAAERFVAAVPGLDDAQRALLRKHVDEFADGGLAFRAEKMLEAAAKRDPELPSVKPEDYGFESGWGNWSMRLELGGVQYRASTYPRVETTPDGRRILHLERTALIPRDDDWQLHPDRYAGNLGPRALRSAMAHLGDRFQGKGWDDVLLHFRRGFGSDSTSARDDGSLRTYSLKDLASRASRGNGSDLVEAGSPARAEPVEGDAAREPNLVGSAEPATAHAEVDAQSAVREWRPDAAPFPRAQPKDPRIAALEAEGYTVTPDASLMTLSVRDIQSEIWRYRTAVQVEKSRLAFAERSLGDAPTKRAAAAARMKQAQAHLAALEERGAQGSGVYQHDLAWYERERATIVELDALISEFEPQVKSHRARLEAMAEEHRANMRFPLSPMDHDVTSPRVEARKESGVVRSVKLMPRGSEPLGSAAGNFRPRERQVSMWHPESAPGGIPHELSHASSMAKEGRFWRHRGANDSDEHKGQLRGHPFNFDIRVTDFMRGGFHGYDFKQHGSEASAYRVSGVDNARRGDWRVAQLHLAASNQAIERNLRGLQEAQASVEESIAAGRPVEIQQSGDPDTMDLAIEITGPTGEKSHTFAITLPISVDGQRVTDTDILQYLVYLQGVQRKLKAANDADLARGGLKPARVVPAAATTEGAAHDTATAPSLRAETAPPLSQGLTREGAAERAMPAAVDARAVEIGEHVFAVHASDRFASDGVIYAGAVRRGAKPGEPDPMAVPEFRPTTHWSLGELVRSHEGAYGFNNWDDKPFAYVVRLNHIKDQLINLNTYDSFTLGDYRLPPGTVAVVPMDFVGEFPAGVEIVRYPKQVTLRQAVDEVIKGRGGWQIEMKGGSGAGKIGDEDVNTPEFFAPILKSNPHLSFGTAAVSVVGGGYRLAEIGHTISNLARPYDNLRSWAPEHSSAELEFHRMLIEHHLSKFLAESTAAGRAPEAMARVAREVEQLRGWLNLVELDLELRRTHGVTLQLPRWPRAEIASHVQKLSTLRLDAAALRGYVLNELGLQSLSPVGEERLVEDWAVFAALDKVAPSEATELGATMARGRMLEIDDAAGLDALLSFRRSLRRSLRVDASEAERHAFDVELGKNMPALERAGRKQPAAELAWEKISVMLTHDPTQLKVANALLHGPAMRRLIEESYGFSVPEGQFSLEDVLRIHPETREWYRGDSPGSGLEANLLRQIDANLAPEREPGDTEVSSGVEARGRAGRFARDRKGVAERVATLRTPMVSVTARDGNWTIYSRMLRGDFGTPEVLWGRLGLAAEYRQRFAADAEFWASPQSFLEIYESLRGSAKADPATQG